MNYYEEIELTAIESFRYHMSLHRDYMNEVVLEADTITTDKNDKAEVNQIDKRSKFAENAKKLLDELMTWLEKFLDKLSNKVRELLTTHQGFKNELAKYRVKYKPTETISVTIYSYNYNYLVNVQNSFNNFIMNVLNTANSTDSSAIINQDPQRINEEIAKKLQLSNVENANQMYVELKNKFRGEKKSVVMKAGTDLAKYENMCLNYSAMESNLNGNIKKIQDRANVVKRKFNDLVKSDRENKDYYKRKLNNLSYILKVYANMNANFSILLGEYMFACREVCKRFYKMPG